MQRAAKHPYFAALSAVKAASVVGVTGIEPAPSWSQTMRLTIRQHPEIIQFSLNYGQTCGQTDFCSIRSMQFARVSAVFRPIARFSENRSRKPLHAPKRRALPTAPHPEIIDLTT